MKLAYIVNARIPTEKAHGIQVMKMCEAFASCGAEVELLVPRRRNPIGADPFEFYEVKRSFKITKLPVIDLVSFGRIGFLIESATFALSAVLYASMKRSGLVFSRDELTSGILSAFGVRVFWEAHDESRYPLWMTKKIKGVVCISKGVKDFLEEKGREAKDMLVAHDGVDLDKFAVKESKEESRAVLGLGEGDIVLYAGHLYGWKGAHTLAEASKLCFRATFVFVGGTEKDIASFKERYGSSSNVRILGRMPYSKMPLFMKAADVVVLPNSAKEAISSRYTSPLKLFEYMSSGTPIVASDLPSLREVLDEETGRFFEPDNPRALCEIIEKALEERTESERRAVKARERAQSFSWEKRARSILRFMEES